MKADTYILYDDDCPACSAYTAGFVKVRILSPEGRKKFSEAGIDFISKVDKNRARHEIALLDLNQGKTFYGLNSLLWLMFRNNKFLYSVFTSFPLYQILYFVYKIISYNRRVISPTKDYFNPGVCAPDFHSIWRLVFVLLSGLVTTAVALPFFLNGPVQSLHKISIAEFSGLWFFSVCVQGLYAATTTKTGAAKTRIIEYAGQSGLISLIGSFMLAPALLFPSELANPLTFTIWFGSSYALMLILHIKRMKTLKFHYSVTIVWILFRIWMLLFLFPDMLNLIGL